MFAWRWSLGGLPKWLVLPGGRAEWSESFEVLELPFASDRDFKGAVMDVKLGKKLVLHKELTFPAALWHNLDKAVELNVRQSMPGNPQNLVFRHRVIGRDKKVIRVEIFLVKKAVIDAIVRQMTGLGARVRTISVSGFESLDVFHDNRAVTDRVIRSWSIACCALALSIGAVLAASEIRRVTELKYLKSELQVSMTDLSAQAVDLRNQIEEKQRNQKNIESDLSLFHEEFHRLGILLDLSASLPDDTWVSMFELKGKSLTISGFTKREVSDAVGSLRELPWVEHVELVGPANFDSYSRSTRFELSVGIKPVRWGK